jgi:hypothetical protein
MTRTTHLTSSKSLRGRPKGSGIDDNTRLQQVAALIAADPALKPTTAIKRIGVKDPSAIRRLRDKFQLAQDELMKTARRTRKATPQQQAPKPASEPRAPDTPPVAAEPMKKQEADQAARIASATTCAAPVAAPIRTSTASFEPFAALMGFGLRAAAMAVEHHFSLCQQALRSPPIEAIIRQQLLVTQLMIAATTPRRSPLMLRH